MTIEEFKNNKKTTYLADEFIRLETEEKSVIEENPFTVYQFAEEKDKLL